MAAFTASRVLDLLRALAVALFAGLCASGGCTVVVTSDHDHDGDRDDREREVAAPAPPPVQVIVLDADGELHSGYASLPGAERER